MESERTFYDRDYKKTCALIGWSLVIFIVLFNVLSVCATLISEELEEPMRYKWHYTLTEVMNMVAYIASFLIPAAFLRWCLKRRQTFTPPEYSLGRISPTSLLLIPATIGAAIVASYVNTLAMSFFNVSEAYDALVGFEGMYEGYQIVLLYVTTALVPAFVEEFLFRGTILANLLPYGKRGAIIISSVLFGLMHQNPYQIIYTVVAGIILGMAYAKTGSIWLPTVMHFINNAYSVTNQVIYANVEPALANSVLVVVQLLAVALGIAALVFYLKIEKRRAAHRFEDGFFGKDIELDYRYAEKPISQGYAVKGFFRASTIIYIVLAVISMLALLIMLIGMSLSGVGAI